MPIYTIDAQARGGLAKLIDEVTHNHERIIIQRCGEEEVALIAAVELTS